jgi:DNA-binding response OmpR family regulator
VVDDQQSITILLAEVLKLDGFETFMTHNDEEALSVLEQQHPDAVIMDFGLKEIFLPAAVSA